MTKLSLVAGVVLSLLIGCGKVPLADDASTQATIDGNSGGGGDGGGGGNIDASSTTPDAMSIIDAIPPDAAECTQPSDCDNMTYCDGVETCTNGKCEAGTPPDCGTTDKCTRRYCDGPSDKCASAPITYTIRYDYTGGTSGTVTLGCNGSKSTQKYTVACGIGGTTVNLVCSIDNTGNLQASLVSSNTTCIPNAQGTPVTSKCSTISSGSDSFGCCF